MPLLVHFELQERVLLKFMALAAHPPVSRSQTGLFLGLYLVDTVKCAACTCRTRPGRYALQIKLIKQTQQDTWINCCFPAALNDNLMFCEGGEIAEVQFFWVRIT